MDGMFGFHSTGDFSDKPLMLSPENLILLSDYQALLYSSASTTAAVDRLPMFGSDHELLSSAVSSEIRRVDDDGVSFSVIKAKIASHPCYPRLLQAYLDCQKVGAPPEIADLLEEIQRENDTRKRFAVSASCFGDDPELDEFMETYCDMLVKYKSDLARPFDEATTFLNKIEIQLRNLCTSRGHSDNGVGSSEEDLSGGETEAQEDQQRSEDRDLKDRLLRRFGSHIGTLKLEFSKKKKKGKLPRDARQALLDWWNVHFKWPYPTEADKISLAESTGLDQKQINNWFINQRKRHWKPPENMTFGVAEDSTGHYFTDE